MSLPLETTLANETAKLQTKLSAQYSYLKLTLPVGCSAQLCCAQRPSPCQYDGHKKAPLKVRLMRCPFPLAASVLIFFFSLIRVCLGTSAQTVSECRTVCVIPSFALHLTHHPTRRFRYRQRADTRSEANRRDSFLRGEMWQ